MDYKNIHIGELLKQQVTDSGIKISRICNFFNCAEKEIDKMFVSKSLDSDILLKWCKLLKYDFFRIYSQHLIFFSPQGINNKKKENKVSKLPQFRKNFYSKEIIDFILELIDSKKYSKQQIIDKYNIPKTTLYKWIKKYKT